MALLSILPGAAILIGCEGGRSDGSHSDSTVSRVALDPGVTLAGAGWVNDWCWVQEDLLREQVEALAHNGWKAYLIEMGGSARWRGHSEEEARSAIAERYPQLVDMLADEGMLLLNSVQNDNAGQGKFGDQSPPLSDQVDFSAWLVQLVAAVGRPDVVLVQPVAETQTAAGVALERHCASVLTNFTLVNNAGSRPDDTQSWATYDATHPWSVAAICAEDLIVGDTTPFIREMDATGDMAGWTSPSMVCAAYEATRTVGAYLFGLYLFDAGDAPAVDHATIEALAEVLP